MLASFTGDQTKMRKKQLIISVNGVTMEQDIWLVDIMEMYILGLDALQQLGAMVDTVLKWLIVSMRANIGHIIDSLAPIRPGAKQPLFAITKPHGSSSPSTSTPVSVGAPPS